MYNSLLLCDFTVALVACSCNQLGAVNKTCTHTGQCFCKDNVDGHKCGSCSLGYFGDISNMTGNCTGKHKTRTDSRLVYME